MKALIKAATRWYRHVKVLLWHCIYSLSISSFHGDRYALSQWYSEKINNHVKTWIQILFICYPGLYIIEKKKKQVIILISPSPGSRSTPTPEMFQPWAHGQCLLCFWLIVFSWIFLHLCGLMLINAI